LEKAGFVAGDTVLVSRGTYIGSGSAAVMLDRAARLLGGWDELFAVQSGMSTIDCERDLGRQGVVVQSDVMATIDRFAVRNAYANSGAGLRNSGTLVLESSSVYGNESYGSGGGISNDGSLSLKRCDVSNNRSGVSGGGIQNNGILILDDSLVHDNTADGPVGGSRTALAGRKSLALGRRLRLTSM
jgi:hypothetical protein